MRTWSFKEWGKPKPASPKKRVYQIISCEECGKPTEKRSSQRYCPGCGDRVRDQVKLLRQRGSGKEEIGKPGFGWVQGAVIEIGRWEPSELDLSEYR